MGMTPIIQRIDIEQPPIVQGERDFARIQKKPEPKRPNPYYFLNTETQAEYNWIEGAFAPPGYQYPGFAIIIALDRNEHPEHKQRFIRVLEEYETEKQTDIKGLIKGCVALKEKYGVYPLLQQGFYTELDEPASDKIFNTISRLYGEESKFWPIPGVYSEEANSFKQYFNTLAHYKSVLDVSNAPKLKNYLLMIKKGKIHLTSEDIPAVSAIAYAVSALVAKRSWQFQQEDGVWELESEY